MRFVEYSIQWAKGEQFEGFCIAIAGILTLLITFLLWKFGTTVNAKSLIVPSFILGILFILMGSFMVYSNWQRQEALQQAYETDSEKFISAEKKRVEDFQYLYTVSLAMSAVCFLVTIIAFIWFKNPNFQAIGIVLSVLGVSLIIIDYFSKERAAVYFQHILNQFQ